MQKLEVCQETIHKIRALSAEQFEPIFQAHLRSERKLSMIIVYFMQEAFRRRVWAQNYSSFSAYCTEKLLMSSSDFYRKYSILKTIEEIPEIEEKILGGEINPSTVAKMSHFFHRESKSQGKPITVEKKREVFKQMEGLTHRQVERELAILSPQSAMPDRTRQITETAFVRQFTSSQELEDKIRRAKDLLAHALPQPPSDCQLFTKIADIALDRIDPVAKQRRADERELRQHDKNRSALSREVTPSVKRENLPEQLRREVFKRDNFECAHVNYATGKLCGSKTALEIDHVIPVAQGGSNSLDNLRLLCRVHNQLRALETFGRKKMGAHIRSL